MWRLADHLASQDYEVTAPDLRGQGLSPPAASYSVPDIAADVRLLRGGWDLVVGHSLGGAVAAVLLADDGFAASAVLIDPVMVVAERDKPTLLQELVAEVGGALTVDGVRATQPLWDDEDAFRLVRAGALVSPHVVRRVVADTTPWDLLSFAERWKAQVTILAADPSKGALFTGEHARGMERVCTSVRVETVVQAGHSVHRDAPDAVLAAIDRVVADAQLR